MTTTTTTATRLATLVGHDGECRQLPDGAYWWATCVAREPGVRLDRDPRRPDRVRATFLDGSVLTNNGDGWDHGFADCFCCEDFGHRGCALDHQPGATQDE